MMERELKMHKEGRTMDAKQVRERNQTLMELMKKQNQVLEVIEELDSFKAPGDIDIQDMLQGYDDDDDEDEVEYVYDGEYKLRVYSQNSSSTTTCTLMAGTLTHEILRNALTTEYQRLKELIKELEI